MNPVPTRAVPTFATVQPPPEGGLLVAAILTPRRRIRQKGSYVIIFGCIRRDEAAFRHAPDPTIPASQSRSGWPGLPRAWPLPSLRLGGEGLFQSVREYKHRSKRSRRQRRGSG